MDPLAGFFGQPEQCDPGSDGGRGAAGAAGDHGDLHAQVKQFLVAGRFLDRGQVGALQVLQQHQLQLVGVGQVGVDDGGDLGEAGHARGREPAVADHDPVAAFGRDDQEVLPDAVGADAVGQLDQVTEVAAGVGLVRVE